MNQTIHGIAIAAGGAVTTTQGRLPSARRATAGQDSQHRTVASNQVVMWMDSDAAAVYTGFARSTLAKLRCVGGGPRFYRVGHSIRYMRDQLDQWIGVQQYANTSQYPQGVAA